MMLTEWTRPRRGTWAANKDEFDDNGRVSVSAFTGFEPPTLLVAEGGGGDGGGESMMTVDWDRDGRGRTTTTTSMMESSTRIFQF